MKQFAPIGLIFIGLLFIPEFVLSVTEKSKDFITGTKKVEYIEEIELYDKSMAIYYSSTKEDRFLSGIFGKATVNEVYATYKDGNTESIPLDMISFQIGEEWLMKKEGIQTIQKDNTITHTEVNSYTIIGPKEELVDLSSQFTMAFKMEFPTN